MEDDLEKYLIAQGFTDAEKKAARSQFETTGEFTHGSSQFCCAQPEASRELSEVKDQPKPTKPKKTTPESE